MILSKCMLISMLMHMCGIVVLYSVQFTYFVNVLLYDYSSLQITVTMLTCGNISGPNITCVRRVSVSMPSSPTPSDPTSTTRPTWPTSTPGTCQNYRPSRRAHWTLTFISHLGIAGGTEVLCSLLMLFWCYVELWIQQIFMAFSRHLYSNTSGRMFLAIIQKVAGLNRITGKLYLVVLPLMHLVWDALRHPFPICQGSARL